MYINADGTELSVSGKTTIGIANATGSAARNGTIYNDLFQGFANNLMLGGKGDDSYNLWDASAVVSENAGQGVDSIYVQYWGGLKLPDNVENLFLVSKGATWGTGNALNNVIAAGMAGATLDGGAGDDILIGGTGADIFRVAAGNGSDAIQNFEIGKDVVQLQNYGITSFNQLVSLGTQVGNDVKFSLPGGEALYLRDIKLGDLGPTDFGFATVSAPLAAGYTEQVGAGRGFTAHGWTVLNNAWGATALQAKDYSIASTYSTADMTKGTTFNWAFPYSTDAQSIKGYPEVMFGVPPKGNYQANPSDTAATFPIKVSDLTKLVADYSVSYGGNTAGFNVAYDLFLTSKPNGDRSTITNEVMVWVHKGGVAPVGTVVGTYTDGTHTATIYHSGTYTAVVFDQDLPSGALDMTKILAKLQSLGIVSGNEYLASVELGAEVVSGAGSLTINNLDLTVQSHAANGNLVTKAITGSGATVTEMPLFATAYTAGATQIFDHGVLVGAKVTSIDASGVQMKWLDPSAKLVRYDMLAANADGSVTTTHFDAVGKLTGTDTAITAGNGVVTTNHYDAALQFLGADKTALDAQGHVTVQHFDAALKLLGADTVINGSNGSVSTQHYDANFKLTGAETVYNNANGSVSTQHFDAAWKLTGAETVTMSNDGTVTTQHYNANWALTGVDIAKHDAAGVTTETHYDGAYRLLNTVYTGTNGADTITGTSGANVFHGGLGSDTLKGGAGADSFYFDTAIGKGDVDQILNFSVKQDSIYLDRNIFSAIKSLDTLSASAFVTGTSAKDADTRIIYDRATGNVFYDADGTGAGAAVLFAHVTSDQALTAAHFHMVG